MRAYDPVAMEEARKAFPDPAVEYAPNLAAALADAQAVVVVTPWKEFQQVPGLIRDRQPAVVLVDGRRAFDKQSIAKYEGIGL